MRLNHQSELDIYLISLCLAMFPILKQDQWIPLQQLQCTFFHGRNFLLTLIIIKWHLYDKHSSCCSLSPDWLSPQRKSMDFKDFNSQDGQQRRQQECIPVGCVPSAAVAVCWGSVCPGCVVSAWEVSAQGVSAGGVCPSACRDTSLPVDRMTDRCKNITLPQLCCGR